MIEIDHTHRQAGVNAAIIVAHPDDEILWAGGFILAHPEYHWFICTLCRASDPDRSTKFFSILKYLHAQGAMANLDDEVDQTPLADEDVQQTIMNMVLSRQFDLVLTHGPIGEYTRHRRHEEVSWAVSELWRKEILQTKSLWLFAYEDGLGQHLPHHVIEAHEIRDLSDKIWEEKYQLITEIYGFDPESWEARSTPRIEAFWKFASYPALNSWREELDRRKITA
jgi:hypothetical protein